MDAETAYEKLHGAAKNRDSIIHQRGFRSGYHARDAEIERLKWCSCGDAVTTPRCPNCAFLDNINADAANEIERLRAGIKELRHICDGTGGYEGESARARLEMGGDKCDELLKGGKG